MENKLRAWADKRYYGKKKFPSVVLPTSKQIKARIKKKTQVKKAINKGYNQLGEIFS